MRYEYVFNTARRLCRNGTIVNKDGSHYIACKNLLLKSYKQKRDLFADIICRFVQTNVHQEQEIANLPYLKLLLLPSTARSSFMKSLLMKDTGVSTIFFELRIAILEIINSIWCTWLIFTLQN